MADYKIKSGDLSKSFTRYPNILNANSTHKNTVEISSTVEIISESTIPYKARKVKLFKITRSKNN